MATANTKILINASAERCWSVISELETIGLCLVFVERTTPIDEEKAL
ncbi:MAG: hypothetical protein ACE5OY_05215 [Candidatus Bathyarchaeia archaeon]